MSRKPNDNWIVFVDTNIFLDFYRKEGSEAVKQIEALKRHREKLIFSDQVLMEFMKNRQVVISSSLRELRRPETISLPPYLRELSHNAQMKKEVEALQRRVKSITEKASKILTDPKRNDLVFRDILDLFNQGGQFFLKRDDPRRFSIRRRATKRFFLGYPPRKASDTSIGDAFNWEWIIECAKTCKNNSHVMIVSRDGGFGIRADKTSHLNDWLQKEFSERVAKRRKILLTARLTDALKKLNEAVSKKDLEEETRILSSSGEVETPKENALLKFFVETSATSGQ